MGDNYDRRADPYREGIPLTTKRNQAGSGRRAFAITPDDNQDVCGKDGAPFYYKSIWVGEAGNLTVIPGGNEEGVPITFHGVPVGWFLFQVRRVLATGTTAANLIGVCD